MAVSVVHVSVAVCFMIFLTWTPRIVAEGYVEDYLAPTPHLKEQIKTRCLDYLAKYLHLGFVDAPPQKGQEDSYCDQIWQVFAKAFAFKDACTVTEQDYMPLFDATGNSDIKDKILFWSKHQDLSIRLSDHGSRAVVLVDTLPGYLLTDFVWCGEVPGSHTPANADGINYHRCPECKNQGKTKEHFEVFWGIASAMFAKRASGVVHFLANGAVGTVAPNVAHHPGTFFAMHELPNINKRKVTQFRLIVAYEPWKTVFEKCGTETIKTLQEDIKETLGIEAVCIENPKLVMHIFCEKAENSKRAECLSFENLPDF